MVWNGGPKNIWERMLYSTTELLIPFSKVSLLWNCLFYTFVVFLISLSVKVIWASCRS